MVKSTFVESKTSPSPGLSSPSQDRVQRGLSPSQDRVQRGSISSPKRFESESRPSPKRFESESRPSPKRFESESRPNVTVKTEKENIFFNTIYLIIYNVCDTRDSISSILM